MRVYQLNMNILNLLAVIACCGRVGATSNEGTTFAIAMTPSPYAYYHGEIILNARHTAEVAITTSVATQVVTVSGNWSYHHDVPHGRRTTTGIEDKGILITSDQPIAVHIATAVDESELYSNLAPDALLARPVTESSLEYFLAGYDDMSTSITFWPMSFYVIVATEDNTEVDVYYASDGDGAIQDEHITLQKYEVFTRDTFYVEKQDIDFTGTHVLATKPVSVYAGNGRAYLYEEGARALPRHMQETMPSISEMGTEYTSFPVHFGGNGGYEVRVIAVADDTDVTVPVFSTSLTLNMGEFHAINNPWTRLGFRVSCSKPCMVVQYNRGLPAGGDTGLSMNAFMAVLIPDSRALSNAIFTVPAVIEYSSDMVAAISVVVNNFPVTGLYLNETSLSDLGWQPVTESSNWFATMELGPGFYQMYTTEASERFTAYLCVLNSDSYPVAIGFPIGYAGDYITM